jgi:hypothetical protein
VYTEEDMTIDARALLREADAHVKAGRMEDAMALWLRIADFYEEQDFFLKAVMLHKQIVQANPARLASRLALASLYATLGLETDARKAIDDAIDRLPQTVRESSYRESAADRGALLRYELESVRATMKVEDLRALRDRWR